jgi:hypothetical protein
MRDHCLLVDDAAMLNSMKRTFFIDIDQTISTGHVSRDLQESVQYYRDLGLVVPDGLQSWPVLFQLPEVVRLHEVLPGAREGVRQLAQLGEVWYATARKPEVEQITREWLATRAFPNPERVIIVEGIAEKLLALAAYPGPLVLVDDRWQQLHEILVQHGERHRVLAGVRERLTLVAFGARQEHVPETTVVPVVPLCGWEGCAEFFRSDLFIHGVVSQTRKEK